MKTNARDAVRLKRLAMALRGMDRRTHSVFVLHRVDRLDYPAIADRLGISVDAVERHMAQALLLLDRAIAGEEAR